MASIAIMTDSNSGIMRQKEYITEYMCFPCR